MTHIDKNKMSNIIDNLEDSYVELKNFHNYNLDDVETTFLRDALLSLDRVIETLQLVIEE